MIPLLSLLPDAALPGPSLLPARLYSSWYLPRVPDPDLGPGLALREYCRNFRRQNLCKGMRYEKSVLYILNTY